MGGRRRALQVDGLNKDFYCLKVVSGFYAPELLKLQNAITFEVCMKVHQFRDKALPNPIHALEHTVFKYWPVFGSGFLYMCTQSPDLDFKLPGD